MKGCETPAPRRPATVHHIVGPTRESAARRAGPTEKRDAKFYETNVPRCSSADPGGTDDRQARGATAGAHQPPEHAVHATSTHPRVARRRSAFPALGCSRPRARHRLGIVGIRIRARAAFSSTLARVLT